MGRTIAGLGNAEGGARAAVAWAAREWQEETGTRPGPLRLVGVVENFFGPPTRRQHELGFYFRMDAPPGLPDTAFAVLDHPDTGAEWPSLSEVRSRPVYPLAVADLLDVPPGEVRHTIVRS